MSESTIFTPLDAARWASQFYEGRSHTLRQISAVAGKVTSMPGAKIHEVIAAWVYRPCEEQIKSVPDQEVLIEEIGRLCSPEVEKIVRSLVVPPRADDNMTRMQFLRSSDSAKRIRIAEVICGLDAAFSVLYGGSTAKVDEIDMILKFASFVYKNSNTIHPDIRRELASLTVSVRNMWNAVMSTVESFERTVGSPDMVPVKIIAVANDLGIVKVAMFEGETVQDKVRAAFNALRQEIGGSVFSETLLHATVPIPKIDIAKAVPPPATFPEE
jgi:hypothetical protein